MIRRIMIVRAGALGDVVMALPAIRVLRECYPEATIEVAGYPGIWAVAGSLVDRCINVERAAFAGLLTGTSSPQLLDLLHGVDLAIVWTVQDPGAVFRAAGIPRTIHASPFPPPGVHAIDWLLQSVASLPTAESASPILTFTNEELAESRSLLNQHGLSAPIILHPGAGASWKCWPAERFATVISQLVRRDKEVALIEGPSDAKAVGGVLALTPAAPVVREESTRRLAAILSQVSIFVGNDTGVTHLAAATGVPTIALFGPTDPASWAPRGDVRVLRVCTARSAFQGQVRACQDPRCLDRISLEDVLSMVDQTIPCRTA
ncbi:MAG: glycosyltransferase family 9 protein [Chloroflexota bacterium]|nr:glycosyltransferase family 9 protein [Chloroflexota bacterium]